MNDANASNDAELRLFAFNCTLRPYMYFLKTRRRAYDAANEFASLDMPQTKDLMRAPIIVDGRRIFDSDTVAKFGFIYAGVDAKKVRRTSSAHIKRAHQAQQTGCLNAWRMKLGGRGT